MKELYQSPELDILCLQAAERLASSDPKVEAGKVIEGGMSFTYNDYDADSWIDIPL